MKQVIYIDIYESIKQWHGGFNASGAGRGGEGVERVVGDDGGGVPGADFQGAETLRAYNKTKGGPHPIVKGGSKLVQGTDRTRTRTLR